MAMASLYRALWSMKLASRATTFSIRTACSCSVSMSRENTLALCLAHYNAMEDELFVMLDTTLSSFCWQRRGPQSVAKPASPPDSFPSLLDKEHLTLGQPTAIKLRTRVLQLDLLEACKKSSVI